MSELNITIEDVLKSQHPEDMLESLKPFMDLIMQYECAIMEVETKLKVLNQEFSRNYQRNPIESIKTRVKEPLSIINKMKRRNYDLTIENIEKCIFDVAGIRVICSFPEDIYTVSSLLANQDDVHVIEKKDYIENPKPNGYRSLHLIIEIPIFLASQKKYMKAEVQFRTIAMDFWASLEHKLKYKKNVKNSDEIADGLKMCAALISSVDYRMQEIRNKIDQK